MTTLTRTYEELLEENERLHLRLEEAEATVEAIRGGEVDAVVVSGPPGEQVYTLEGADHPYRLLVEAMQQGVATLNAQGTILYCNPLFAGLLKMPQERVIGAAAENFLIDADRPVWADMLARAMTAPAQCAIQIGRERSLRRQTLALTLHLFDFALLGVHQITASSVPANPVEPAWCVVSNSLFFRHSRSAARPRVSRLFTVPRFTFRISAISS